MNYKKNKYVSGSTYYLFCLYITVLNMCFNLKICCQVFTKSKIKLILLFLSQLLQSMTFTASTTTLHLLLFSILVPCDILVTFVFTLSTHLCFGLSLGCFSLVFQ